MEHLDLETVLNRMGSQYRRMEPASDYFEGVKLKIEARLARRSFFKVLGIALTAVFVVAGIVAQGTLSGKGLGRGYSSMIYISYAFILMTLITIVVINSQKFFTRMLGGFSASTLKKINEHRCYFSHQAVTNEEETGLFNRRTLG